MHHNNTHNPPCTQALHKNSHSTQYNDLHNFCLMIPIKADTHLHTTPEGHLEERPWAQCDCHKLTAQPASCTRLPVQASSSHHMYCGSQASDSVED